MKTSPPIRVLIAGGTTADRHEVEQAIQQDRSFDIIPLEPNAEIAAVDADALVLIQESSISDHTDGPGMVSVLGGTPTLLLARADSGPVGKTRLTHLPKALWSVVQESQHPTEPETGKELPSGEAEAQLATRAMRESQRLAAIGKLTAEIAHEINNPLESVGNLVYLAMHETGMPAQAVEFLRAAERELQRIVQISKQTLSFSRESAEPVAVRVTELMDEVLGLYGRRIGQKKLAVIREYNASETILGLPGELRQVFSNLVTNAIEATSTGGTLRLRIRSRQQHQRHSVRGGLRITIGDTGAGIPEAARRKLGQMFFTTKGESGTGLGLWVTRGIITRYGGTLQLRSSTGEEHGTVFSIFLPSAAAAGLDGSDTPKPGTAKVTEISRHPSYASSSQRNGESAVACLQREG